MEIASNEGNESESEPLWRKGESKGRESLARFHPESSQKTTEPEISHLLNATHHPGAGRVHTQVYSQCTNVLGLNEGLQDVPISDGFHTLISPNPEQTKQACKKHSGSGSHRRKNPNKGKGDLRSKRSTDYEGKNQRFDLEPQDTSPMFIDIPKGSKRKLNKTFEDDTLEETSNLLAKRKKDNPGLMLGSFSLEAVNKEFQRNPVISIGFAWKGHIWLISEVQHKI
ncbi:hypothetical protein U1Q18_017206 [Sarracenia purpurea var. burkii]